ncbi:MAG: hypothetical protein WC875_01490 [Candidatus Absconditabacterales bacterium]|jgi:hypothetical protein
MKKNLKQKKTAHILGIHVADAIIVIIFILGGIGIINFSDKIFLGIIIIFVGIIFGLFPKIIKAIIENILNMIMICYIGISIWLARNSKPKDF